ncbi:SUKH-4 family immunity protein [Spongiactinospora sp. 9N601]|uniref:SUKH-4 family immunity protein n=1 Tax=Spongiactinospora sp. 9N601 TaxID=3375149 RepID=UPI0037AE91FD
MPLKRRRGQAGGLLKKALKEIYWAERHPKSTLSCPSIGSRIGVMKNHHYSADFVEPVQDDVARAFLVKVGLPARSGIFAATETERGYVVGGRNVLRLGYGTESEGSYYLDCHDGSVLYVEEYESTEYHVNASPQHFTECLTVSAAKTSGIALEAGPDELEELAASLETEMSGSTPRPWPATPDSGILYCSTWRTGTTGTRHGAHVWRLA